MITLHYAGQHVHKETIEVVAFRENEMVPCIEKRIPNHPKSIKKVFRKLFIEGSVIDCYEAGCMGFTLQLLL
jgi:hypothetical protein